MRLITSEYGISFSLIYVFPDVRLLLVLAIVSRYVNIWYSNPPL